MTTALADLGSEEFVSLTTFRRSGEGVATPVWVARLDGGSTAGGLVVTTVATTGKVKRIRHTPRVTLRPCTRSGRVEPGAPEVAALAEIVEDPAEVRRLTRALVRKYGLLARLFFATDRFTPKRRRVALRLREVDPAASGESPA